MTTRNPLSPAGNTNAGGAAADAAPVPVPRRVGLVNQGCTCYLNSLLQAFFHLTYFRISVFKILTDHGSDSSPLPKALQSLFYQLQERTTPATTKGLTDAFGWDEREVFIQHDIQELAALLRDSLETRMKGTSAEGNINLLFAGYGEKYFTTLDRTYTSRRPDVFYDIHVPVQGYATLMDGLKSLIATEQLTGDNKYKVEEEGKPAVYKDAETGYRFMRFPPVIFFHLKRFEMDMMSPTLEMKKVNSAFEFPQSLDLTAMEHGFPDGQLPPALARQTTFDTHTPAIYDLTGVIVHRGGVRSGHYFCYMRDFDHATRTWQPFMEFDDDAVRYVDAAWAVDRNFGGYQVITYQGRESTILSSQNAYMLAYVRRADVERVIFPGSSDYIPPHIRAEYQLLLEVEERQHREDEERRKNVTIQVLSDFAFEQHVRVNTVGLFAVRSASTASQEGTVVVLKTQKWNEIFAKLGAYLTAPGGGAVQPSQMRLWACASMQPGNSKHMRPTVMLPLYETDAGTVAEVLQAFVVDDKRPWNVPIFIEFAREAIVPALATNAAEFGATASMSSCNMEPGLEPLVCVKTQLATFAATDLSPTFTTTLAQSFTIQSVCFRTGRRPSGYASSISFRIDLIGDSKSVVWTTVHTHQYADTTLGPTNIMVRVPNVAARRVVICRTTNSQYHGALQFSRLQINVPAQELLAVIPASHPVKTVPFPQFTLSDPGPYSLPSRTAKAFPSFDEKRQYFVFVKHFNHLTGTMHFCGTAVLNNTDRIANVIRVLQSVVRVAETDHLTVGLEQLNGEVVPLDEEHSVMDSNSKHAIVHGSILVTQVPPTRIPLIHQFITAEAVARSLNDRMFINVRNVAKPEEIIYQLPMMGRWNYLMVTECIAEAMGGTVPATHLRLYGPKDFSPPTPNPSPERSDKPGLTLERMLTAGSWGGADIWVEVLAMDRRVVESRIQVKCILTDKLGRSPFEAAAPAAAADGAAAAADAAPPTAASVPSAAEFVVGVTATVAEVVQKVLTHYGQPFDAPHVLLEVRDHLVFQYHRAFPASMTCPSHVQDDSAKHIAAQFYHQGGQWEVRPFDVPRDTEFTVPVLHGDYLKNANRNQAHLFGCPFLINLTFEDDVPRALEKVLLACPIPEAEQPVEDKLALHTHMSWYYPTPTITMKTYVTNTANHSRHESHLILNHKRPKEKPGSRYVAHYEPQLVIDRSKRKGPAGGEGTAAT